ncbi:MAG: type II toxin-antitoxin system RatA family toxin [Burkholderiales bacterium]
MIRVEQAVLVPHSAERMFLLVDDVASYPKFLPWCGGIEVKTKDEKITEATIKIDFHGLKQSFTTRNEKSPFADMDVMLVDGPFKHLQGHWRFHALSETACKVELELEYEFTSRWLEKLVGPVFSHIATTLIDAFVRRAEALHGPS